MQPATHEEKWREGCAPCRILELFATRWTSMVLYTLRARHGGVARTGVHQRSLPGISKKMLTQTVRDMEASGLVSRHVYSTIPPMVEYRLTDLGRRLVEPVELLYGWSRARRPGAQRHGYAFDPTPASPAQPCGPASVTHRKRRFIERDGA